MGGRKCGGSVEEKSRLVDWCRFSTVMGLFISDLDLGTERKARLSHQQMSKIRKETCPIEHICFQRLIQLG